MLGIAGLAFAAAARGAPAPQAGEAPELTVRIVPLRHQTAGEAVALIYPLLSARGSVEVRSGDNAVVVRDDAAVVARVVALLEDFDRPARPIRLAVQIVSAAVGGDEPPDGEEEISEELARRLRELLRFTRFRRLGAVELEITQGQRVASRVGASFRVEFLTGRLETGRRLRLEGFRILRLLRGEAEESLIHTNLNLRLDKPMVLGLARTEASETALMVVLEGAPEPAGANP